MKAMVLAAALAVISVSAHGCSVDEMLNWGDQFRAMYGNELKGKTPDGYECILSSWDKSFKGQAIDNREGSTTKGEALEVDERSAYLSLGANQAGSSFLSSLFGTLNWIGFTINPGISNMGAYQVKAIEVTPTMVHMNVAHEEVLGNYADGLKPVQNDLTISTDGNGNIVNAVGSSSHFPTINCKFGSGK